MSQVLTLEQGELLAKGARKAIASHLSRRDHFPPDEEFLKENRGVFVTLLRHPSRTLRGCIGFPLPVMPLGNALVEAAVSAATRDSRFPPLSPGELDELVIDVSVLTVPEKIKVKSKEDLPKTIKCGVDGLIIKSGSRSGLLLPQVATEHGMSEKEFLDATCMKAGLSSGCWLEEDTDVERFQAQVFSEKEPNGDVVEEEL